MENKSFNKNTDYTGKWCLFRKYDYGCYDCIYIYAITDGIVRYEYENSPGIINYEDIDDFKSEAIDTFIVSPFQPPAPNGETNEE